MKTFEADASVSLPSRNRIVSAAPASAESWRSRQLPMSEIDLMSQRSQRLSCALTRCRAVLHLLRAAALTSGLDIMKTVGSSALGERVVALRHAARHLEIDPLVVERLRVDQRDR